MQYQLFTNHCPVESVKVAAIILESVTMYKSFPPNVTYWIPDPIGEDDSELANWSKTKGTPDKYDALILKRDLMCVDKKTAHAIALKLRNIKNTHVSPMLSRGDIYYLPDILGDESSNDRPVKEMQWSGDTYDVKMAKFGFVYEDEAEALKHGFTLIKAAKSLT